MRLQLTIARFRALASRPKTDSTASDQTLIPFVASFFLLFVAVGYGAQDAPHASSPDARAALRAEAKGAFENICASCHGLDARGGERGPDLATRPDAVRKTDAELLKIIRDGKAAEGMPSFASFGPAKLSALVVYLRELQGRNKRALLPGDPTRGKALFFGTGKCAECHSVGGKGGFWGRDLTAYASNMAAGQVRSAIVTPNKDLDPRRGLVTVTLTDSTSLSGLPRNEDNFSLQLQTTDGAFHLLSKSEIRAMTYLGRSPMPSDYSSTLSVAELNDLVSYLLVVSRSDNKLKARGSSEEDDEE